MADATVILRNREDREVATRWVSALPDGSAVAFTKPKRSLPQNDLMWELLTLCSRNIKYHGLTLTPTDWKDVASASLKSELRTVPNLDGTGLVILGLHTSQMSVGMMSDLIELLLALLAREGVKV